ncbi:MAG: hypothetical protein HQL31_12145, partial [Planctomycetes bacterium]|nr:hypothetical protein [Planctomycetota bacterium]
RYNRQAYAYLRLPAEGQVPSKSMRRIRAVEEHQELGAGFRLAMRDMEIRGVGNILGEDQHGNIEDIGYELYAQFLSQALAESRGEEAIDHRECELVWPAGSTNISEVYMRSHKDRIDFYRRISFCRSVEGLQAIAREAEDRFGVLPPSTLRLFSLFRIKLRLRALDIQSFKRRERGEQAVVTIWGGDAETKLAWVLAHQEELAFYREEGILLRVDRIWTARHGELESAEPGHRYSYQKGEHQPDPLAVLETLVDFIEETLPPKPGAAVPAAGKI